MLIAPDHSSKYNILKLFPFLKEHIHDYTLNFVYMYYNADKTLLFLRTQLYRKFIRKDFSTWNYIIVDVKREKVLFTKKIDLHGETLFKCYSFGNLFVEEEDRCWDRYRYSVIEIGKTRYAFSKDNNPDLAKILCMKSYLRKLIS